MHPHVDRDIVTLPLTGRLRHLDHTGAELTFGPGQALCMSAGSGIEHDEHVVGDRELFGAVISLMPRELGTEPRIEVVDIPLTDRTDRLAVVASHHGPGFRLHTDASISIGDLGEGTSVRVEVGPARQLYIATTRGAIAIDGVRAEAGERLLVTRVGPARIDVVEATELIAIDLPA